MRPHPTPQVRWVKARVVKLLGEIRMDAVPLVDSFGLSDYFLNSALGAEDGDYPTRMFAEVQRAPFNASNKPPGYERNLRQLLAPSHQAKL